MVEKPVEVIDGENFLSAYNYVFSLSLLNEDDESNLISSLP